MAVSSCSGSGVVPRELAILTDSDEFEVGRRRSGSVGTTGLNAGCTPSNIDHVTGLIVGFVGTAILRKATRGGADTENTRTHRILAQSVPGSASQHPILRIDLAISIQIFAISGQDPVEMIDAAVTIQVGDAIGRQGPIHHIDLAIAVDILGLTGGDPIQMINFAITVQIGQSTGIVLVVNAGHRVGHGLDIGTRRGAVGR